VREGVSAVDPELAVHAAVRRIIRASFRCETCGSKDYGPDGSGGGQRFSDDAGER
jgi:hypothetical protein